MAETKQTYHYRALDAQGRYVQGSVSADDRLVALTELQTLGLAPLAIGTQRRPLPILDREIGWLSKRRLKTSECQAIAQSLSFALQAGLSSADALDAIAPSGKARSHLRVFHHLIKQSVRRGRVLSAAIAESGFQLPADFVPVLEAGERTGELRQALDRLALQYASSARVGRAFLQAALYPAFLLLVSLGVLGTISFGVAPTLEDLFSSMERPVPGLISFLASAADWLKAYWGFSVIGGLCLVLCAMSFVRHPRARHTLYLALMRVPGIADHLKWASCGKIAAALELCLATHVPATVAARVAYVAGGINEGDKRFALVERALRRGQSLSAALTESGVLPLAAQDIVLMGERSGHLLDSLRTVVREADRRVETYLGVLSSLLAPCLILVVGILSGTIIYSVFSALMELNQLRAA